MSADLQDPARSAGAGDPAARLLDTFLQLVRIDSPSGEESAAASHVLGRLREAGLRAWTDDAAEDAESDTGNVIAELEGTAPGRTVVLCAHLDTVEPGRGVVPVVSDGVVSSAGDTILGADDKAGVAVILETLVRLQASGRPHARVRVLLTVAEERGLQGAKALREKDAEGDLCLVLDADGVPGGIVTAAPTHYTFSATFHGRSSHAGVEPEKGVSAIRMAAGAVASMALGRLDEDTTANIGRISGGGATNIVPSSCTITGECRSTDAVRVEEVREAMETAMRSSAEVAGGTVTVAWTKEYDGFRFSDDDPLVELIELAMRDSELEPRRFRTGGGSDGNVLSAKGLPSIVLSSGMRDVHGTGEKVAVADMESLVRLLLLVLERATG